MRDGDKIQVDLPKGTLHLAVSDEELEARRKAWVLPQRPAEKGLLERYARMVGTARDGATFRK